ncbi:hypothetical protein B0F90DRAFT_1625138 [Multifurca ochricompacta]|uniref:NAD(P)-binding protein n=1 Tax=Multifurca ochricompacta TaxID=376703 RepID=A0AAD4MA04_9AGAM|nr:hypothetical protein B0F90DRAFT_1625138 [Multifurca ochricompacta]
MGSSSSNIAPSRDLLDLHDRVAIVTGANSGIGLYIALHLVRRGAKVYLAARSEEKAAHAITRMENEGMGESPGELVWLPIDLTDPHKAKAAAEWFLKRESRLDILGVYSHHISPFLFTKTLLPLIEKTASKPGSDVRIVNVSSIAHRWAPNPRYDSLEAFNNDFSSTYKPKTNVYAYTKLANVLWTKELQRKFNARGIPITAMSVHPGNVMSALHVPDIWKVDQLGLSLFFISPHDGGYTPAWAAASRQVFEEREKYKGKYLVPYGTIEEASKDAQREDLAKELWETTENVLKEFNWL